MAAKAYKDAFDDSDNSFVFMNVSCDTYYEEQKVIIELYDHVCPKTCQNFKALCNGFKRDNEYYSFVGSDFDKIVNGQII